MERGTALKDPKKSPANTNLPLREGHNKVPAKRKKKKRFFSYKNLSSTATGYPSNQKIGEKKPQ